MNMNLADLKQVLKKRLFDSISAQIDLVGYVPDDISKLLKNASFDLEASVQVADDMDLETRSGENGARLASKESSMEILGQSINNHYDKLFYDYDGMMGILHRGTEYRNIGYWDESTTTQNQASERLHDALLDFIPEKSGRILDVACGMGASTRRLLNHYSAENIWAINISEKQIESTRQNAPGCNIQVMNAVDLKFDNNFFDNILCIEAVMHFETRQKFLEESFRVLKKGGQLVLSDILFTSKERLTQLPVFPSPENYIASVEEYHELLEEVGFGNIVIEDVSNKVWGAHFLRAVSRIHENFYAGDIDIIELTETLWTYYNANSVMGLCLFISAQK
ncbi:MAG: methyltransferase domain-containing protein [Gammaproteobacteria bacterium]|nr:methyltransferase domain-containing protein [Gammaproteobacteria bacterium]